MHHHHTCSTPQHVAPQPHRVPPSATLCAATAVASPPQQRPAPQPQSRPAPEQRLRRNRSRVQHLSNALRHSRSRVLPEQRPATASRVPRSATQPLRRNAVASRASATATSAPQPQSRPEPQQPLRHSRSRVLRLSNSNVPRRNRSRVQHHSNRRVLHHSNRRVLHHSLVRPAPAQHAAPRPERNPSQRALTKLRLPNHRGHGQPWASSRQVAAGPCRRSPLPGRHVPGDRLRECVGKIIRLPAASASSAARAARSQPGRGWRCWSGQHRLPRRVRAE